MTDGPGDVDVTVVAVAWNTAGVLPSALRTLPAAAGALVVQYVVVDNGSTDHSVPELHALRDPEVEVVELRSNTGFTHAANVGAGRAAGRHILFCNPDIAAPEGAIERLVEQLDARTDAWAVTPWFVEPDGSPQWFWRRLPGALRFPLAYLRWGKWIDRRFGRPVWRWRSYRDLDEAPSEPVAIDAVGAAFLLVRREDLEAAGGLDDRFFNFFSDAALARHRRGAGRVLLGCGDVHVVHDRGITFRDRPRWQREAEFLAALRLYAQGEPRRRRWPMLAALRLELVLPHRHRQARRQTVLGSPAGSL